MEGNSHETGIYNDVVEEILLSGNLTAKPNSWVHNFDAGAYVCFFLLLGTECLRHFAVICINTVSHSNTRTQQQSRESNYIQGFLCTYN